MTGLIVLVVIAATVVTCFKAYQSVKLLEKDPEAWSRMQQAEDGKAPAAAGHAWESHPRRLEASERQEGRRRGGSLQQLIFRSND